MPDDLFSEFQRESVLENNRASAEMHFSEVQALLPAQRAGLLDPSTLAAAKELRASIEAAINTLTPREAMIIRARFGFDGPEMTLKAIGQILDVSAGRVMQIEARALRKLRHPSRAVPVRKTYTDFSRDKDAYTALVDDNVIAAIGPTKHNP